MSLTKENFNDEFERQHAELEDPGKYYFFEIPKTLTNLKKGNKHVFNFRQNNSFSGVIVCNYYGLILSNENNFVKKCKMIIELNGFKIGKINHIEEDKKTIIDFYITKK